MENHLEFCDCDLCGSSLSQHRYDIRDYMLRSEEQFTLVECQTCKVIRLNPRPTLDNISSYYPPALYWKGQTVDEEKTNVKGPLAKEIAKREMRQYIGALNLITRFSPTPKKGLDVGCGTGQFTAILKNWGWDMQGVEFSPDAANFAKNVYGLKVLQGDLLDCDLAPESFDLLTLVGVLEHLQSPRKTLERAHKLLREKGWIVVAVPNSQSLACRLFKKYWYGYDAPRHLYHFDESTLCNLLRQVGFQPRGITQEFTLQGSYILKESLAYALRDLLKKIRPKKNQTPAQANPTETEYKTSSEISCNKPSLGEQIHKLLWKLMVIPSIISNLIGRGEIICVIAEKI